MRGSRTLTRAIFAALSTCVDGHGERGAVHFCLSASIKNNPCYLVKLSMKLSTEIVECADWDG